MFTFKLTFGWTTATSNDNTTKHPEPTFTQFFDKADALMPHLTATRRPATVKNYHTALRSLRQYTSETATTTKRMTARNLLQYEQWLQARNITRNTTSCYTRSLRSIYHTLYPQATTTPFHQLYTGNTRTAKRALDLQAVRRLIACKPPRTSPLRLWYDVFLFSIYALGMPFVDLAYLRHSDIADGFIHYHRHKTAQPISVPLTPEMHHIINHYRHRTADNLVFSILHTYHCPYNTYQHRLSLYNHYLKQLRRQAHITQNLTSYVARHTWATLANSAGLRLTHISHAMGHTDIKTTQIYLSQITSNDIKADSLAVTNLINGIPTQ